MNIVKWKYRIVKPGEKGHTIDGYIDYVEKQVEDRRNETGTFALDNSSSIIGTPTHDKELVREKEGYDVGVYSNYMDERKGSRGVFSNPNMDSKELIKQLKAHEGAVWIPIVSMKEKDAIELQLTTEEKWQEKAQELAEEYRKQLDIPKDNFRWVAAFHTKAPEDQNKEEDAGCQPHLHFILWEEKPVRSRYSLTHEQIENVRERTSNILSRDYMKQFYQERNELREKTVNDSLDYITKYGTDVKNLVLDIEEVVGRSGKLNVAELEKRENIAYTIVNKMENSEKMTPAELYYKDKFRINNVRQARRVAFNYSYINNELDNIATGICKNKDINRLLENWNDLSIEMRRGYDTDMAQMLTNKDFDDIKRRIKNGILDECKDAAYDNTSISPTFRGLMMEKLADGYFKKYIKEEQIENTVEVVSQLCKTIGMPENDTKMAVSELLARSEKEEFEEKMMQIIEETYIANKYKFGVTSKDFKEAMKSLGMPVTRQQSHWKDVNFNPYAITENTVLKSVANEGLEKLADESTLKPHWIESDLSKLHYREAISPLMKAFASVTYETLSNDYDSYSDVYNNLLNAFSSVEQGVLSREDELDFLNLEDDLERQL